MGRIGKIESIAGYVDQNRTILTLAKVWIPVAAKTTVYVAILWRTIAACLTTVVRIVPGVTVGFTLFLRSKITTRTTWTHINFSVRVEADIVERFTQIAAANNVVVTI